MPRFSDNERKRIQQKLMQEGERLFTAFGLKKVSIDEIVQAVGIAKGSFYSFYTNKEHLYMNIAAHLQLKMWSDMDTFLSENRDLPPRELCKQCFLWMFSELERYPLLKQVNNETAEYLYRKLPPEVIEAHTQEDSHELIKLQEYGVHFTCGINVAAKTLQTLAISFLNLQQDQTADQQVIMKIILEGVLKEIVSDERN